jgi:hypothetical protein
VTVQILHLLSLSSITEMLSKWNVYIIILVAAASTIIVGQSVTSSLEPVAQSSDKVTSTILKNAGEDLEAAVDALKNNNVTGAVNEASLTHTDWRDALNLISLEK